MSNKLKCKDCRFYDSIGAKGRGSDSHGRCAVKSVYPAKEGPGQVFPDGVRRVAEGELAKPFVVEADKVISSCVQVSPKATK
jgi:hypothetical protein